jgi:murein DD-endopeptidase MepM/ murein hydrolase activator NlpD
MVDMTVAYRGPDGLSAQLWSEVQSRFGARAQNKGFVTGYMDAARAGQTGGHFADQYGVTHAVDLGVDIEDDGTGLTPTDALVLAESLRLLGKTGRHPFSRRGYLIHDMSTTTTPLPKIAGFHTGWEWLPYTGASPHSDHIHVTTGGDVEWGGRPQLDPDVYNSREPWGIATVTKYYRPVPSFIPVSQDYGTNATASLPADHWLIRTFGNYQPNGHTGRDYACAEGTDVYAVADGTVLWADWATSLPGDESHAGYVSRWYISKTFAGICLVIDHGEFLGVYAHLSRTDLNIGDRVRGGERVAASGNTGGSTGPHLHFECIDKNFPWGNGMYGRTDPDRWLRTVTTLSTGYTGTTINAPEQDWFDMATEADLRRIVAEETKKAVIRELTYPRDKLGGAGGTVSIQDEILHTAANEAKTHRKLDALVSAVTALVDRAEATVQPIDYEQLGRAFVVAVKETP